MDNGDPAEAQRMAIKVSGPREMLSKLATQCRMEAGIKRGLTGVVYGLDENRIEIVAEGKRLDKFVEWAEQFVQKECAGDTPCEVATVAAKKLAKEGRGAHGPNFPIVNFEENVERRVQIVLQGDRQVLDYTLRHTKIEAGFNRKLKYTSRWLGDTQLELLVEGPAAKLKSFVRWCRRGPPLQRPEQVGIHWLDTMEGTSSAEVMGGAFRDEGVSV